MSTSIITGLNPNIRPSLLNFRGWAFSVDGDNLPRYFDANQGYSWRAITPTTDITTNESVSGSMSGVFQYFYTEFNINSGEGTEFYGHESAPSPIKTTGNLSSKQVTLTLPSSALNAGFTHFKIYSTDAGGTVFYYIGKVSIGTTTFTDNALTRDANFPFGVLSTDEDNVTTQDLTWFNQISNPKFIIPTKTRILGLGTRIKNTGTASATNGSATVTGSSTLWTKAIEGSTYYHNGESRGYVVLTVNSSTSITLAETYKGTTAAGKAYEIKTDGSLMKWTALDPLTSKPQWWAWPTDFYRYVRRWDDSDFMGGGSIGDNPIAFKKHSHYLLTENGNDFEVTESSTRIGTCSHWSICNDPDDSYLFACSYEGRVFKTTGLNIVDLGIDLLSTEDGFSIANGERCQSVFYEAERCFIMIYPSYSWLGSGCDRMLVYYKDLNEWVIWKIQANCISIIEETVDGQKIRKPWIGTVGGFVYRLFDGNNLGASSGTLSGTITTLGASTLTDSTATFFTTEDGLKDVPVTRYDSNGDYIEERLIASNTATQITVSNAWSTSYTAGETYEVGGIFWDWKSKVFDFNTNNSKEIRDILLNFKKVSTSRKVKVKFYFSDDADMGTTADQSIEFDLSYDYNEGLSLFDNRYRYCQIKITGHGTNDPVTLYNIQLEYSERKR